jgi:hypothetical protein
MMSPEADDARAPARSDESGEWLRTISSLPADSEAVAWDVTRVYRMSPVARSAYDARSNAALAMIATPITTSTTTLIVRE